MMQRKKSKCRVSLLVFCWVLACAAASRAQTSSIDTALAHQYFDEAEQICRADNGKLWGVSLCAPILFVDRKTRLIVANKADAENHLTKDGNVFTGHLPERVNIANTAIDWAGTRWAMIIWPLPEDKSERAGLLAHESWHRIQDTLKLPGSMPANAHLDSTHGRLWLQLEWRALAAALTTKGDDRRAAAKNALTFRAYRRMLFPQADAEERALEMNEGLAEYTGVKLSGRANLTQYAAAQLKSAEGRETFVRSFAYASGAAYGVLLDEAGAAWRKNLLPSGDLGSMLQKAFSINLPPDIKREAEIALKLYGGEVLLRAENERERKRQQRLNSYRASLVDNPVLAIPLQKMNMQFNPNNPLPLDGHGTIYPDIRIVDVWGVLTVRQGALMNPTFTAVYVSAPVEQSAQALRGNGWTLDLNAGWTIKPGARKGDYVLQRNDTDQVHTRN